ncbi:helix-turn-helix domain-containing protein [Streptomyces sp. NPDC047917]|uniref:helix-turn-helix domain-containing protein n=1 Tax=Streptomyces sp. NPDC047917 TaxID=3365491 RepID=UPI0037217321
MPSLGQVGVLGVERGPTSPDITRLTMNMPRAAVAKLLGLCRNTGTAHLNRTEASLGLDLTEIRCRAAFHLALVLSSSHFAPEPHCGQPLSTLDDLTERAAAWAQPPSVSRSAPPALRAWADANTDAQEAARALGVSRNTIRTHLRASESVLSLDLLTAGTGIHDIVHAVHIANTRAS